MNDNGSLEIPFIDEFAEIDIIDANDDGIATEIGVSGTGIWMELDVDDYYPASMELDDYIEDVAEELLTKIYEQYRFDISDDRMLVADLKWLENVVIKGTGEDYDELVGYADSMSEQDIRAIAENWKGRL